MVLSHEQLKKEIDLVSEQNLETLYQIIVALQQPSPQSSSSLGRSSVANPLKGSVTFEHDIVSPIDVAWDAQA